MRTVKLIKSFIVLLTAVCCSFVMLSSTYVYASGSFTFQDTGHTEQNTPSSFNGLTDNPIPTFNLGPNINFRTSGDPNPIVYNVKIEWDQMLFEYDYGNTWDPYTHSYITGVNQRQDGSWVNTSRNGYEYYGSNSGTGSGNNIITFINNSNFPVKIELSFEIANPSPLNSDLDSPGRVMGVFGHTPDPDIFNAEAQPGGLLNDGYNSSRIAQGNYETESFYLECVQPAEGSGYYGYVKNAGGPTTTQRAFALSGTPDPGGPKVFTHVGTIKVKVSPATGVTKVYP